MRRALTVTAVLLAAALAEAGDAPLALGTLRIQAFVEPPRMPPIPITQGPLQEIIDTIVPEDVRPLAHAWELELDRHRRLLRAAEDALDELDGYYAHQIVLRANEAGALRELGTRERTALEERFARENDERVSSLRSREAGIVSLFAAGDGAAGPPSAAGHLLLAEIRFAQYEDTYRTLLARWRQEQRAFLAGERADPPIRPRPYLDPVVRALEVVRGMAADRLTRERTMQLLAVVRVALDDHAGAAAALHDVLKGGASWILDAELKNRSGDALLALGRYAGAARAYGSVTEASGTWLVRARLGLAWARHRMGDDDGALAATIEVRRRLEGLFEQSATALTAEADRLYAQLLADRSGPLPADAPPRVLDSAQALRARATTLLEGDGSDDRAEAVRDRVPEVRRCYRRLLLDAPGSHGRLLLLLPPRGRPTLDAAGFGDARFKACLDGALKTVMSPAGAPPGLLVLELSSEAPAR